MFDGAADSDAHVGSIPKSQELRSWLFGYLAVWYVTGVLFVVRQFYLT